MIIECNQDRFNAKTTIYILIDMENYFKTNKPH
jgi:hypothetical protein